MNSGSDEEYKTQESSSEDDVDELEEFELCKSEEQFLKKYGAQVDDLKISTEDLLCPEDMKKVEKQIVSSYSSPTKCNIGAYNAMKNQWIQYFQMKLGNGYYNGNLAISRCSKCTFIIECFPCKEKRHYYVPASMCEICTKKEQMLTANQFKAYKALPVRRNWVYYKVY